MFFFLLENLTKSSVNTPKAVPDSHFVRKMQKVDDHREERGEGGLFSFSRLIGFFKTESLEKAEP